MAAVLAEKGILQKKNDDFGKLGLNQQVTRTAGPRS
jgi:hypothetical protein